MLDLWHWYFKLVSKRLNSIDLIDPHDSGLVDFKKQDYEENLRNKSNFSAGLPLPAEFYKYFARFLLQDNAQLESIFAEDPALVSTLEIKALRFLNLVFLGKSSVELKTLLAAKKLPDPDLASLLSHRLAKSIMDLYALIHLETDLTKGFDRRRLLDLAEILPEIKLYYSLFHLFQDGKPSEELLGLFANYQTRSLVDEQMQIYLYMVYYQLAQDSENLENYRLLYREKFHPDLEKPTQVKLYSNRRFYRPSEVLKKWSEVLSELDDVQRKVNLQAGLLANTCEYFECSDCCKLTFPVMTLTEYLYLKDWLEENNYDQEALRVRAEKIQEEYEAQFGERLVVIDKSQAVNQLRGVENPHDFKYTCPFLDERGACSCYEARPLLCRGFGLATDNGKAIKTCNYYLAQYQYNSNFYNERHVYDLRPVQMLAKSSDKFLTKNGHNGGIYLSGTIVAWFGSASFQYTKNTDNSSK